MQNDLPACLFGVQSQFTRTKNTERLMIFKYKIAEICSKVVVNS